MKTDFLIIGSGIAGLSLALKLSEIGHVTVFTKKGITSGSTGLAQGGIAGVTDPEEDSPEEHFNDTMKAGAFHNDEDAVHLLVENGENALKDLKRWGVEFDFSLHKEGGHTFARIYHVADETGRVVQEILADEVLGRENIEVVEHAFVVDLLVEDNMVYGISFHHNGEDQVCLAQKTIIATGGAGQIYAKTTNPSVATGDGMVMASRAGAKMKDMEFIQFHPTALDMPRDPMFLLSEALRGAGAKIVDEEGNQFVDELAPRDIVAQQIFLKQRSGSKIFLDLRHKKEHILEKNFPMIFDNLLSYSLNLARDLIPITPAAHFFCGGVQSDIHGRTSLMDLYVLGEAACSGVHGANRLASNSLLEGVVFAEQIFRDCQDEWNGISNKNCDDVSFEAVPFVAESPKDQSIRKEIQRSMQDGVGVAREPKEMKQVKTFLKSLNPKGTETKNLHSVALLVVEFALKRKNSLGCHYLL